MRVQLQQARNNIGSVALDSLGDPMGVTVGMVWTALEEIYATALTNRMQRDLQVIAAFAAAKAWAVSRPPLGVSGAQNVFRQLFTYGGMTYRIDIENLAGTNLRFF
jgi:hypothetical protein